LSEKGTEKNLIILLSVLLAASTASVRVSLAASAATPEPTQAPSQAIAILTKACTGEQTLSSDSAAYAAEMLRWEAGFISRTSLSKNMMNNQLVESSFDAAARLMETRLRPNWSTWSKSLSAFEPAVYDSYSQNISAFSALADALNSAMQTASAACVRSISRDLREAQIPLSAEGQPQLRLTWRECAALYYVFGEQMSEHISSSFSLQREGSAYKQITLSWANPTFEDIAKTGTHDQLVEAILALDYFNTVYRDDGSMTPAEEYPFTQEYLKTIIHPVKGGLIKNGWYDPRSRRTRLHMGTDIKRRAKTPILSMTDGVVKYIGYLPIPGYYVMIQDPYGFVYHYYHMFELTTFVKEGDTVKQGQQIGIVGSTGNSAAYHLHLGLVTPEGKYVNPYDLFVQAGIGPILPDF
jgi:murein DD-endopeptidase MepM/ murein hydrolase activator NlpD